MRVLTDSHVRATAGLAPLVVTKLALQLAHTKVDAAFEGRLLSAPTQLAP